MKKRVRNDLQVRVSFRVPKPPLISLVLDQVTIDMLHDDVLLEIFNFYQDDRANRKEFGWGWIILVQVCRRWRQLIFESPRRLDIQLVCTPTTPTKGLLEFWPHFPIIVCYCESVASYLWRVGVENSITALECRDRASLIDIFCLHLSELRKLIAVMNKPFPILTKVSLRIADYDAALDLPETFLGGSAPSLRSFSLEGIRFPTLPKFILSSTRIVHLFLNRVGYISPEVIASCLAALPKLNYFRIGFRSPLPHIIQISAPTLPRAVLPALTHFSFRGVSEYFEALVAQIDTPILKRLSIAFFISTLVPTLEIPRIHDFVNRIESLGPFGRADVEVSDRTIRMTLGSPTSTQFRLALECGKVQDRIMSPMTQIFSQQLRLLSHVEQLEIRVRRWENEAPSIDSSLWLGLFRLFIAVKSLYISDGLLPTVSVALKRFTPERTVEVFPALGNFYLPGLEGSGSVPESIGSFIASRQLSGHPVVVENWERQLYIDDDSEMGDNW